MDVRVAPQPWTWDGSPPFISPLFVYTDDEYYDPLRFTAKLYESTRIKTLIDERERIQKKTFTKWSNTFLHASNLKIEDLYSDLCDGRILLKLLETVSGYQMPCPTPGRMRIHCLENVEKSLNFLDQLNVHLENVGAHDIVDGNCRIILGLIWTIILRFQVQSISVVERVLGIGSEKPVEFRRNSKEALLLWCKMKTKGYPNVSVDNFTTCWRDGLAFNAIIHKHRPDLSDFESLSSNEHLLNLETAFSTAENHLGIARLLDPEDILVDRPDEKSIITYLTTFYHYFSRQKSDTVHARRIERIINLLKAFTKGVKSYELSTTDLLQWIKINISHLNERQFERTIEGVQLQLQSFSQFRTIEKPPRFNEKGNLEIELFVIQSQMTESGMRLYKPPKKLQVSAINKAWRILESSEHNRGLAIHQEMIRLELLDQLFMKFELKSLMRETWLRENQNIAKQDITETSMFALQVALKKHEALEADIFAYKDRIQILIQISNEIQSGNHVKCEIVAYRCDNIHKLWEYLLKTLSNRRHEIERKLDDCINELEINHLLSAIHEVTNKLNLINVGNNLNEVEMALKRLELLELEIRALYISLTRFVDFQSVPPLSDRPSLSGTRLRLDFDKLVDDAQQKRRVLERSARKWQIVHELNLQITWIQDKLTVILQRDPDKRFSLAINHLRQHKLLEEEIENRQQNLDILMELAEEVIFENGDQVQVIIPTLTRLKGLWDNLIEEVSVHKHMLLLMNDIFILLADIDDATGWISEKHQLAIDTSNTMPHFRDLKAAEVAVKKNQELLNLVNEFSTTINHIHDRAVAFLEESYKNSSSSIKVHKFQEHIKTTLEDQPSHLSSKYEELLNIIKQNQSMVIDALSIHQLFHNATEVYSWITEKDRILSYLQPLDLSKLDPRNFDSEFLDDLFVIKRRFHELEEKMNSTADQVASINKSASNIIEASTSAENTLFATQDTVVHISSMRDHLNSAWNELADAVEERRYQLNSDALFLRLCQDCNDTAAWINDKKKAVYATDLLDVSSTAGILRLQHRLSTLQVDIAAIRAKTDDIGERIGALDYSIEDRREWLEGEHLHLSKLLRELEQELEKRINCLFSECGLLKHMTDLDNFLNWLGTMRERACEFSLPCGANEAQRMLDDQERFMHEIDEAAPQIDKLLAERRRMSAESGASAEPCDIVLNAKADQLLEEWMDVQELANARLNTLRQSCATQNFLAEVANLEVLITQQDTYLAKDEIPISVETADALIDEQRAFIASLKTCEHRLAVLMRTGNNLAVVDSLNRDRILKKLESLRNRLAHNKRRAQDREKLLEENRRLQNFYRDVDEVEDWITDKRLILSDLSLKSPQRNVLSAYNKLQALQDEVDVNRDRAENVIDTGRALVDSYGHLELQVGEKIDGLRLRWEDLLTNIHADISNLGESRRELLMNEATQSILEWTDDLRRRLEADMSDPALATSGLADLQARLSDHADDCQEEVSKRRLADEIKEHAQILSRCYPGRTQAFTAVINEVIRRLDTLNEPLKQRELLLTTQHAAARHLLDLTAELFWARDKLSAVRPAYLDWPHQRSSRQPGAQLLIVRQKRCRLKNHVTEVENRAPRVKQLCIKVKEEYLSPESMHYVGVRVGSFRETLGELERVWFTLTHTLKARGEELRIAEKLHKFLFDADEIAAWVSERELYLQSLDDPTGIDEADRALRRMNALSETIAHWTAEVERTCYRGNDLGRELQTGVELEGEVIAAPSNTLEVVHKNIVTIDQVFTSLQDNVLEKTNDLKEAVSLHDLLYDIAELEEWIARKHEVASSHEVGTNLEHCFALRSRFTQFAVDTQDQGNKLVLTLILRCDRLIMKGHKNRSDIALGKDRINEAWADLLEMIDTREQLLKSSLDMHRFMSEAQDLEERIKHCSDNLPAEPSVHLVSGRAPMKGGLSSLHRHHAALQKDLSYLAERVASLGNKGEHLLPLYAGQQEMQLRVRRNCVIEAWGRLGAVAEQRARLLDEAMQLQRFLQQARILLEWLEEKKEEMSHPNGLSRTIYAVERLVADHRQLHSELGVKADQIETCLETGRAILEAPKRPSAQQFGPLYRSMIGPRGEVREACVLLATERLITGELWRERWDRLQMLLDVRYFMHDSESASAWLNSREIFLMSARRNLGDTLAETIAFLGAHYAFEKACAGAEARFDALKRLTRLEIHAMEWTPADAKRHDHEHRENIRRAVREFMPSSTGSPFHHDPKHAASVYPTRTSMTTIVQPTKAPPKPIQASISTQPKPYFTAPPPPITTASFTRTEITRTVPIPRKRSTELIGSRSGSGRVPQGIVQLPSTENLRMPSGTSTSSATSSVREQEPYFPRHGKGLEQLRREQKMNSSSASIEQGAQPAERVQLTRQIASVYLPGSIQATPSGSSKTSAEAAQTPTLEQVLTPISSIAADPLTFEQHQLPQQSEPSRPMTSSGKLSVVKSSETSAFPRLEGPLVRKWDLDAGGGRHNKSRSWTSTFISLQDGRLTCYRDQKTCKENSSDTLHGLAPIDLAGARAAPALDYSKRRWVFRLRLFTGAEFLFQALNDEVLYRWVSAINDSAAKLSTPGHSLLPHRAFSLPTGARHSSSSSPMTSAGPTKRYGSLRKLFKRN